MVDTMTFALEQVKAGTVRALAVSRKEPYAELKGVPVASQVVPGLEYESWLGLLGPRGLPTHVADRLNQEVREIVALPDVGKRLNEIGAVPEGSSIQAFQARCENEIAHFNRFVEIRKIARQ